ncbi:glycerophosphocholine cholinephosphodiesterase ENPP6-like [Ornithodoros turicata]|uniref:glycerophosphocholine cholinephosphodiesterase ENPP6-like n=1 Tax=Ornithodoros turicata TaxID=34597 RepID=UPI0031399E47
MARNMTGAEARTRAMARTVVVLWICCVVCCAANDVTDERQKVILVLVDGCRWDYLEEPGLLGFRTLAENGVKAEYVLPVMPSSSYPNWYSIVTGLYPENHGFVSNIMYDEIHHDFFLMAPDANASLPHWWNHAEPIWITAEKHGRRTSMYWWDGCQVVIRGRKPTHCAQYISYWQWTTANTDYGYAFTHILDKLENNEVDMVMVYYEGVDAQGHASGPDSIRRKEALKSIDTLLLGLQEKMQKRKLYDKVNLVVVSDHGMTNIDSDHAMTIDIAPYIDLNDVHSILDSGAFSMIRPYIDKIEKVYKSLVDARIPGLRVYKRRDLPEEWHLKDSYLTQPIVIAADKGYSIKKLPKPDFSKGAESKSYRGGHGYDPVQVEEMRTIFLARGPGLKKGFVSPPLNQVDHYNMLCSLLGIPPNKNDGNMEAALNLLSGSRALRASLIVSIFLPFVFMFVFKS